MVALHAPHGEQIVTGKGDGQNEMSGSIVISIFLPGAVIYITTFFICHAFL